MRSQIFDISICIEKCLCTFNSILEIQVKLFIVFQLLCQQNISNRQTHYKSGNNFIFSERVKEFAMIKNMRSCL